MMKVVALGSDFVATRERGGCFVDKTRLIAALLDDPSDVMLITRPRRFGKTFNLSMLAAFFSLGQAKGALFEGTAIARAKLADGTSCMDFQGKYPVIFITLKDLRPFDDEDFISGLHLRVQQLYKAFRYLLESPCLTKEDVARCQQALDLELSRQDLVYSLFHLTQCLHAHHGEPVVLLIDEYDTPVHHAYAADQPFHQALLDVLQSWLGMAFKDNPHLAKGVMTGILQVSMMNLFSGMNSVPVYSLLNNDYSEFFGFTEAEVQALVAVTQVPVALEDLRGWYNGYCMGGVTLYNPWSVMSCLRYQGRLSQYWTGSGDHGVVGKALLACKAHALLGHFIALMNGEAVEVAVDERTLFADLGRQADSVWGLMVYAGYLNVLSHRREQGRVLAKVVVPNREVLEDLQGIVRRWVSFASYPRTSELAYAEEQTLADSLSVALASGQVAHLVLLLRTYMEDVISCYDFHWNTEERFYHIFLLGMMLLMQDRFTVHSNKEIGYGRFDIALAPKDPEGWGVIFELKSVGQSCQDLQGAADEALAQIEEKGYDAFFRQQKVARALCVGMAFAGKKLEVAVRLV